ncbi:MAG: ABC transporter permease [Tannerellaceae bacterium]|jgi:ABC-type lipoprotein release transport system permease subunit|nr:ABC transporter permease [Tannerellaceae bacterium]
MKLCKLAYRNIWRNKRRAAITIASVFFAVFFCSIMDSQQKGMWEQMIYNTLRTQAGHIEIHGAGYWEDKIIDNFMTIDDAAISEISRLDNVDNVSPRVEVFALASFGNAVKGIAVVGISPGNEAKKFNLASHITKGGYLSETDDGIIIGEELAGYLQASVGDTVAFIGQGHFGVSAAGLFPVRGVFHFTAHELNSSVAYASLPTVQNFIDMPNGYSGILITLKDGKRLDNAINKVKEVVDTENNEVYPWHFTMQRLLQTAESDQLFSKLIIFILYLIVGFGILGTVIMLTNERKKEFRTMISLGMQRGKLALTVVIELLLMAFIGVLSGLAISYPVAAWFHFHPVHMSGEMAKAYTDYGMEPILPTSTDASIFVSQIIVVLIIVFITAIYPVRKIKRINLIEK